MWKKGLLEKLSDKEWSDHQHFVRGKGGALFGDEPAIKRWNKKYSAEHGDYQPKKMIVINKRGK